MIQTSTLLFQNATGVGVSAISLACLLACAKTAELKGTVNGADSGAADSSTCTPPAPGCSVCGAVGLVGSWYAQQVQNCQIQFRTEQGSLAPTDDASIDIVVSCISHEYGGPDAGLSWQLITPLEIDSGATATLVILTLPTAACDLVKSASNSRVDVYASFCATPIMCGG
jgi:hypothetical protein